MNKLLLLCPISRAVRVQRPATCYRLLHKSFSTTTCRKFEIPSSSMERPEESEEEKNLPSLPVLVETEDLVQNDIDLRELFIGRTKSFC